jgi:AcrR family transcriptional regulator
MQAEALRPDRRRTRNRAAILEAAETLFGTRGVDAVSIDEIAAAADLAKGTLYNHFADKEALAAEVAQTARADGEARVAAANEGVTEPARRLVRGVIVFARYALERADRARVGLRMSPNAADIAAPVNAGLRADLEMGFAAGRFSGVGLEGAALGLIGTAHALISRILGRPGDRAHAIVAAREAATFILRGVGLKPGEATAIAARETADIFGETTP